MMTKYGKIAMAIVVVAMMAMVACKDKPQANTKQVVAEFFDDSGEPDTTYYGICGDGTAMHTLELKGDDGRLHTFLFDTEDSIQPVYGGLLSGDRLAVIAEVVYGDTLATRVINLTTLQGKWASLDRNFEIKDGGVVESNVDNETNPWTAWRIFNGQLLLNRDTFDIMELGADSLFLESTDAIYGFKRVK